MPQNIYQSQDYLVNYITKQLSESQRVLIPKSILEMEDLTVDELGDYFYVGNGPFGLIVFSGFRRAW